MRKEVRTILLACLANRTDNEEKELSDLLVTRLDWGFIAGALLHHRLSGYFLRQLNDHQKEFIFPEVRKSLELLCKAQRTYTMSAIKALLPLLQAFAESGVRYAGLKGVVLDASVYSPGSRRSYDTDILVLKADLPKVNGILRENGYIQMFGDPTQSGYKDVDEKFVQNWINDTHETVPYHKALDCTFLANHEIDVNYKFGLYSDPDTTAEVLEIGTKTYEGRDYQVRGLVWETQMAHLCSHFSREGMHPVWTENRRDVAAYKVVDIVNTWRACPSESALENLVSITKRFGWQFSMFFTLHHSSQFYPDIAPKWFLDAIKPNDDSNINRIHHGGYESGNFVDRQTDMVAKAFNLTFQPKRIGDKSYDDHYFDEGLPNSIAFVN